MVGTENRLKLGCTPSPASLIVNPWTRTWFMTVARISSDISTLSFSSSSSSSSSFLPPSSSSSSSPTSHTHSSSSSHIVSSIILRLSPSHLQQPVCSLNWLILVVTSFETGYINFEWLCSINDMCSLFVFDCCHLCLPVWMTCALECRMCFENENVFKVLLKSLSEICKLCFTMWNGLRYWQQTAQLAQWGQATENFVQPMGFSVLAIEKNCNINVH